MKTLSAFFLVMAVGVLAAADLTTKSGDVYKDFSIIKVYRSGVVVSCAEGIVSVPLSDLPDDLREKYAPQVEEFRKKREKEDAARRKYAADTSALRRITLDMKEGVVCVQVLRSGVIAKCGAWENNFYIDGLNVSRLSDGSTISKNGKTLRLYCIGTFSYRAVNGAQTTIPRFTVNRSAALKYLEKNPDAQIIGMQKAYTGPTEGQLYRQMWQQDRVRQQNIRPQMRRQYRR